jgi:hypothetical protein
MADPAIHVSHWQWPKTTASRSHVTMSSDICRRITKEAQNVTWLATAVLVLRHSVYKTHYSNTSPTPRITFLKNMVFRKTSVLRKTVVDGNSTATVNSQQGLCEWSAPPQNTKYT